MLKHKSVPAQTAGEGKSTSFVIGLGRHGLSPRPKTQTPIRAEKSRPTAAAPRECVPNRGTATYPLVTTGGGALPLPTYCAQPAMLRKANTAAVASSLLKNLARAKGW